MKAIIVTGGKQYCVSEGDTLFIEKLEVEAGEAEGEVVEVRADARKNFGGRNFGGMRKDSGVKF